MGGVSKSKQRNKTGKATNNQIREKSRGNREKNSRTAQKHIFNTAKQYTPRWMFIYRQDPKRHDPFQAGWSGVRKCSFEPSKKIFPAVFFCRSSMSIALHSISLRGRRLHRANARCPPPFWRWPSRFKSPH